jgi:hypothetical protein
MKVVKKVKKVTENFIYLMGEQITEVLPNIHPFQVTNKPWHEARHGITDKTDYFMRVDTWNKLWLPVNNSVHGNIWATTYIAIRDKINE